MADVIGVDSDNSNPAPLIFRREFDEMRKHVLHKRAMIAQENDK